MNVDKLPTAKRIRELKIFAGQTRKYVLIFILIIKGENDVSIFSRFNLSKAKEKKLS